MDTTNLKQRAARIANLKKELEASEQNVKVAEQHAETLREQRFDMENAYGREHLELGEMFRAPAQALELIEHVAWLEEAAKRLADFTIRMTHRVPRPDIHKDRTTALDVRSRLPKTEQEESTHAEQKPMVDRTDGADAMAYLFSGTEHRKYSKPISVEFPDGQGCHNMGYGVADGELWVSPELTYRQKEMSKKAHEPVQDKVNYDSNPYQADKQIQPELTKQHTGPWRTWQGGERPVSPATRVQVTLRHGQICEERAECFRWESRDWVDDVVAFRVVQPDHPECSGDPSSCPENEGYGCCNGVQNLNAPQPPAEPAPEPQGVPEPIALQVPKGTFDGVVPSAIRGYLRRCSSGGMPKKHIDIVEANVDEAERLGYFKLAIAEALLSTHPQPPAKPKLSTPGNIVRQAKIPGAYRVVGTAVLIPASIAATPPVALTIYASLDSGRIWARPTEQFEDGRFVLTEAEEPPATEERGDAFTDGYFTALADKENRA